LGNTPQNLRPDGDDHGSGVVLPFLVEGATAPRQEQGVVGGGWSGEVGQDDRQAGTTSEMLHSQQRLSTSAWIQRESTEKTMKVAIFAHLWQL